MGKLRGAAIGFAVTTAVLAVAAWLGVPLSPAGALSGRELALAGFACVVAGTLGGLVAVGRLGAAREPLPEDRWLAGLSGPSLAAAVHIALLAAGQTVGQGLLVVVGGLLVGGALGTRAATTPGDLDPGEAPDLHWRHRVGATIPRTDPPEADVAVPAEQTEESPNSPAPGADPPPQLPAQGPAPEGPNGMLGPQEREG